MEVKQQAIQLELALGSEGAGAARTPAPRVLTAPSATLRTERSVEQKPSVMEAVVERENLKHALKRVQANGGSPGVDGMTVEELPKFLKHSWPRLRERLVAGNYQPQPVKRVEISKPAGGVRKLGIPTVLDRFIQQALLQILQPDWDPTFSEASFGFRPGRSAHQAIRRAREYIAAGSDWVVDIDLEQFFDRVNHDKLMSAIAKRVADKRVLRLLRRYLEAGVLEGGLVQPMTEGTPQGGPVSPLLSNLVLDELDRELERRGHRFVRYADDCNVYVSSEAAGQRVMASLEQFITRRLRLRVNREKSAVARPWERKFLGVSFIWRGELKCKLAPQSLKRLKARVRAITQRTRGRTLGHIVWELNRYLRSWMSYFGIVQTKRVFQELDQWIRRRLRCYLWKQWGRRGYRELKQRGVPSRLAWDTAKSAHGPWRLSYSPALSLALPIVFFDSLGLVKLTDLHSTQFAEPPYT